MVGDEGGIEVHAGGTSIGGLEGGNLRSVGPGEDLVEAPTADSGFVLCACSSHCSAVPSEMETSQLKRSK